MKREKANSSSGMIHALEAQSSSRRWKVNLKKYNVFQKFASLVNLQWMQANARLGALKQLGNKGQQWATKGNNGQQSAVLHASMMPFL